MAFATWISMPRQTVYRCDPCSEQAWIPDSKPAAPAQQQQQQQQQQQPQKKDGK
jgi:hypothetical protein